MMGVTEHEIASEQTDSETIVGETIVGGLRGLRGIVAFDILH